MSESPSVPSSKKDASHAPVAEGDAFDDEVTKLRSRPSEAQAGRDDRSATDIDIQIPEQENPEEDRGHSRVKIEVDVTARSDDTFWVGVTENISEGGLFVATSCPWPEDTVCELTVALDDGEPSIYVEGLVTWIREDSANGLTPGMGVSFLDLDAKIRARIQAYVSTHISRAVLWA